MHAVARNLFPRRNDYSDLPWDELLPELARFGIVTRGAFTRLMKRHRRRLIAIDRDRLSTREVAFFKQEFGAAFVSDALRGQYWFALQALVRTAMELQFGEAAAVYDAAADQAPD